MATEAPLEESTIEWADAKGILFAVVALPRADCGPQEVRSTLPEVRPVGKVTLRRHWSWHGPNPLTRRQNSRSPPNGLLRLPLGPRSPGDERSHFACPNLLLCGTRPDRLIGSAVSSPDETPSGSGPFTPGRRDPELCRPRPPVQTARISDKNILLKAVHVLRPKAILLDQSKEDERLFIGRKPGDKAQVAPVMPPQRAAALEPGQRLQTVPSGSFSDDRTTLSIQCSWTQALM